MPVSSYSRAPLFSAWTERYEVVRRIGTGGFAEVYEALDLEVGDEVALKVVDERRGLSARVVREVEAAASLSHPGIVALLDWFSDGRRSFLVCELVRGETLAELQGELDDGEAVDVAAQLCDALHYAHTRGVTHRDIKPHNVMLDQRGRAKVMDFGVALLADASTLTAEGEMVGTVAYMSPEQAGGRRVGPPSDVYSAGLLLYELLTGVNPLRGSTAAETIGNVLAGRFEPLARRRPDLPGELTDAVDAALQLQPGARPAAIDLAEALRGVADRVGGPRLNAQRLIAPLRRLDVAGERALGAALAFLTAAIVLERLPAYPASWTLPLATIAAVAWLVVPPVGLAWLLGALAFPLFNVSPGVGVVYLGAAALLYLVARGRPLVAMWAPLAVVLAPMHLALVAAAGAAVFGRRAGPPVAAWSGAAVFLYLSIFGPQGSPFAGFARGDGLAPGLAAADPLTVATRCVESLATWPAFAQMLVWAGLAAAIGLACSLRGLSARLWVWSVAFTAVFLVYRLVPILVWEIRADLGDLLLSVVVTALLTLPFAALGPGRPTLPGPDLEPDDLDVAHDPAGVA